MIMNNDDNKLKDLFASFEPELSSDAQFIARLERSMEAVEIIKKKTTEIQRRNILAIRVAALVGFSFGIAFCICAPYLVELLSALAAFGTQFAAIIAQYSTLITWSILGAATLIFTYLSYEITLLSISRSH